MSKVEEDQERMNRRRERVDGRRERRR